MKRFLLTLLASVAVIAASLAATRNNTFSPDKVTHNFGTIEELGGKVSHTFIYTNYGKKAVAIALATTHCDCAKVTYSKQPIRPGGKTKITVTYDPDGHPGMFSKAIQVRLTDGSYAAQCRIAGKVKEAKRTLEQRFPYVLGGGLRADLQTLDFSGARIGSTSSLFMRIVNTTKKKMVVNFAVSPKTSDVEIETVYELLAGEEKLVAVSYLPSQKSLAMRSIKIVPSVGGKRLQPITMQLPRKPQR